MDRQLKAEVENVVKNLRKLPKEFSKRKRKNVLRPAAKIMQKSIRAEVPISDNPHFRYATSKVLQGVKAPKGSGQVVATYYPGNARRSIRTLLFRRSADLFVGPKVAKSGGGKGEFKGNRVDGWYLRFLEFGTINLPALSPIKRGFEKAKTSAAAQLVKDARDAVIKFKRENGF